MALERIGLQAVVEGANAYVRDLKRMRQEEERVARGAREAETQTGKAFGRERMREIGGSMTKAGGIMSASLTAPIVGVGLSALNSAKEFEAGMNQVRAVSGATGDEVTQMSDLAKEMGSSTKFSAGQAAEGMNFLAMAGFEVDDIMTALPGTLELATAANMELGRTADIVSNVLTGYGMEAEEVGRVNDVFAKAMSSANVTVGEMGEAMKMAAPVAASAGLEFEETSAAISMLGDAGLKGTQAGTILRGAMSKLLSPTGKAKDAIAELGLETTDSQGNLLSMEEIIRQLEDSGASTAQMMEIFGLRAGPGMASLVDQGADAMGNMTQKLRDSGGTAGELADVQMEGLQGALHELKASWEAFGIAIAEAGLLDFASDVVRGVGDILTNLSDSNPELLKFASILGGVAAAAGPVVLALGSAALVIGSLSPPVLAAVGAATALAAILGTLAVDADELPGPMRAIVEPAQMLAESLPAVAAGVGALITAMAVQKVYSFATATGGLVDQLRATQGMGGAMKGFGRQIRGAMMTPMGAIGGVTLAMAGLDQVVRKMTGDGIMGHLSRAFEGVDYAAKGAEQGLDDFESAMTRAGDSADPLEVGLREVEGAIQDFNKRIDEIEDIAPIDKHARAFEEAKIATQEYGGEIAGVIEGMREQGVSARELTDRIEGLPSKIQEVVKEEIAWKDLQDELVGELRTASEEVETFTGMQEILSSESLSSAEHMDLLFSSINAIGENAESAKSPMESYRDVLIDAGMSAEEAQEHVDNYAASQEESGETAEEATSPMSDYIDSLKEADEAAGNLDDALAGLTDKFAESNPQVIANNAAIANLEVEKAKLEAIDRDLTEAEQARLDSIDGSIERLEAQNTVQRKVADSYGPLIDETLRVTGATEDQAFAFSQAMITHMEDGEMGRQAINDLNEAFSNTDPEKTLSALSDIHAGMEENLGPAATEEIFRELGPMIRANFEDASPEVIAAAKEMGILIPESVDEGVEEGAESNEDPLAPVKRRYGSRESQEEMHRTGMDTGHQFAAGVSEGVNDDDGEVAGSSEGVVEDAVVAGTQYASREAPGVGTSYTDAVAAGTTDEDGKVKGASEDLVEDAVEAGATYGSRESPRVGAAMTRGAGEGIDDENAKQSLFGKISSLVDDVMDYFTGEIESGSPSRLTANEIGRPIVQGIAVGMTEEEAQTNEAARTVLAGLNETLAQGMNEFGQISGDRAKHAIVEIRNVLRESGGSLTEETRVMAQNLVEAWGNQVDSGMAVNGQRMRELLATLREDLRAGSEGAMDGIGEGVKNGGGVVAEAARNTMGRISDTLLESMKEVGGVGGDEAKSMLDDIGAVIQMSPLDEQMRANAMSMLDAWRSEVQTGMNINEEELLTLIRDLGFEVQSGIEDVAEDTAGALDDFAGGMAVGTLSDIIDNARGVGREGARNIVDDFVGTLEESRLEDEMTEKFGDLGGDVATALGDALADPEGRGGATLANHVQSLLDKAREEGVEGIEGLGDDLIENLTRALEDGSDEAAEKALEILGKITGAIEEESPKISKELGEGFEEGMLTAEEVLTGWHEKLGQTLEQGNELTEGNTKEMFSNLKTVLQESDVPEEFRRWAGGTISDMAEEFENGGDIAEEEVRELIERIGTAVGMADEECEGLCEAGEKCSCGGGGGEYEGPGQAPSDRPRLGRPGSGGLIEPAAPSFDVGAWNIPEDMMAQVHAGEMIVPAGAADLFREIMAPMPADSGGDTRVENNMNPTFVAQGQTEEEMRRNLYNAVDDFMRQRRSGSINSGAVLSSGIG